MLCRSSIARARNIAILSLLCLAIVGCGENNAGPAPGGPAARWASFPVTIYADADILADPDKEADLISAIAFWNDAADEFRPGQTVLTYGGAFPQAFSIDSLTNPNEQIEFPAVIPLSTWPFAEVDSLARTVRSQSGGVIISAAIGVNEQFHTFCPGACGTVGELSYRRVFAHELGHLLGLDLHSDDVDNILFDGRYHLGDLSLASISDAQWLQILR